MFLEAAQQSAQPGTAADSHYLGAAAPVPFLVQNIRQLRDGLGSQGGQNGSGRLPKADDHEGKSDKKSDDGCDIDNAAWKPAGEGHDLPDHPTLDDAEYLDAGQERDAGAHHEYPEQAEQDPTLHAQSRIEPLEPRVHAHCTPYSKAGTGATQRERRRDLMTKRPDRQI